MTLDIAVGVAAGLVSGAVFFGGLRWTLARLASSRRPLVLAVASFLLRGALLAVVLVVATDGDPVRILAALVGILATRTVLVALTRRELDRWEAMRWT